MYAILQSNKVVFTKEQSLEIEKFGQDLEQGNVDFAFEDSIFEGYEFLKGITNLVETINH